MKQPTLRPVPHEEKYEVTRDVAISVNAVHIIVPRFFRYDGASIPAIAWQLIHTPFHPVVMGPALVHDWLYYNHQVDRETADDLFADLLKENGIASGKRYAMWAAVRSAGGLYWENDEEDIEDMVRICRKLKGSNNFGHYHFPQSVIERCDE